MTRGAVLFAHNNGTTDYYRMAVYTAKRINRFLDLPVSIITDSNSITVADYNFDRVILQEPDTSNIRKSGAWINKGRYSVFEHTPYSETLLLDTDYMINSQRLLDTFSYASDIVCHHRTSSVLHNTHQEVLSRWSSPTLWATVIRFRKTVRAQQLFESMAMIQQNYTHYSHIHKFQDYTYRNDYALTLALRLVNGHIDDPRDFLHWNLLHVDLHTWIHRVSDTQYVAIRNNKPKNDWVALRDIDFHMLDKKNFAELINE